MRNTSVQINEAGGITQRLSAFTVKTPHTNETITFLDTPGHSAFFRMRRNGAHVADLVLLIIALDEGVCSQTRESFHLAYKSGIPVIIALNKVSI